MKPRSLRAVLAPSAVLLLAAVPVHAAPQALTPGRHVLEGSDVSVTNLAGEMRIVDGTGSSVVVEITTAGKDRDRLTVAMGRDAQGRNSLRVIYPERRVVYPGSFAPPEGVMSRSSMDYLGHRVTVTSRGPGLEAHADVRILVPRGTTLHAHNAVGKAFLTDVGGTLSFEGASSDVEATRVQGALSIDVGSGNVSVSRTAANTVVDTGSGDVRLTDVNGNVSVDAGSGDLQLRNVGAEKISLDAGSGSISGSNVKASAISADCGSGDVDLDGTSAERVALQAGSGSVHLRLTQNVDRLAISAGSGSVKLEAPRGLSARFRIECPKRNLHMDFPADIERGDEDSTEGTIGGGQGSISIEAGSGRVDLVRM
jgi:putative adhesin